MKDKNLIREKNLDKIIQLLFQKSPLVASDLVRSTNISMVTVNSLLKELVDKKIVFEGGVIQQNMGRPSTSYSINYNYSISLHLSIQEQDTKLVIKSKLLDLKQTILEEKIFPFSELTPQFFKSVLKKICHSYNSFDRIGLSFPGKVFRGNVQSSWHNAFDNWNWEELINEVCNVPVFCQNDAHLLTIGYCIKNKIELTSLIVGIFYPEKSMPGITIFMNNQLLEGHLGLAGEAKYLPFLSNQKKHVTPEKLALNVLEILKLYNVVIAPEYFVVASSVEAIEKIQKKVIPDAAIKKQPNKPIFNYTDKFEDSITLGLQCLLYKDTPFKLR